MWCSMKCAEQPRNWSSLVSGRWERRLETSISIRYAFGNFRMFPSLSECHEESKTGKNKIILIPIRVNLPSLLLKSNAYLNFKQYVSLVFQAMVSDNSRSASIILREILGSCLAKATSMAEK